MKFSVVFTTLFAALASAAPQGPGNEGENRGLNASRPEGGDRGDGRGDGGDGRQDMKQIDLEYLLKINDVDLRLLVDLGRRNNLNVGIFEELFRSEVFSLESLLQLQQLSTFLAIAETGVFDRLDLSRLSLDTLGELNLGLIENIARVDLGQFIDDNVRPQIIVVVQQSEYIRIYINRRAIC
ncbi:hypothetical protein ACJZ2D_000980 [Fusarium nematophilum]